MCVIVTQLSDNIISLWMRNGKKKKNKEGKRKKKPRGGKNNNKGEVFLGFALKKADFGKGDARG